MIFGSAFCVGDDALENFEHFFGADDQAGFFQDFAFECVLDFFTGFDEASGEGPVAF